MRWSTLAWGLLALAPVLLGIAFVLDLVADGDLFEVVAFLVLGLPYAAVGALIAARQPAQPIGWLMLGCGLSLSAALASDGVVNVALEAEVSTVAGAFALVSSLLFSVFFVCLVTTLLLLPNGRLASPRWRIAARSSACSCAGS